MNCADFRKEAVVTQC